MNRFDLVVIALLTFWVAVLLGWLGLSVVPWSWIS